MSDAGEAFDLGELSVPTAGIFTTDAPAPVTAEADEPKGPDVARLKKMVDDSQSTTETARKDSETSRDYFDGYQLSETERATLNERGQPPIENNRIRGAVNGILGVVENAKSDPRAYLRDPGETSPPPRPAMPQAPQMQPPMQPPMQPGQPAQAPQQMGTPQPGQQVMGGNGGPPMPAPLDAADVATMALRFIADTTYFQRTKIDVLENMLIEGSGAAIFEVDGQDVQAVQIRWEEFFYDPRSRRNDFKDARYMGIAKWMYADYLAAIYPKMADKLNHFATNGEISGLGLDMSWEDRPHTVMPWFDRTQRRLMVCEIYYVEGQVWNRAVFHAGDVLEFGPSPYKDDKGNPVCPIEAVSAYVDRQNRRVGIVRDMRCIQDEVNMRRSKALHEMNTRQVQQSDPTAPQVDVDTVRTEAAKPDGIIPPGWTVVPRSDVVASNMALLAEAKAELERFSPNPAILGRQGADASGRSQQIRQQAGMTELARVLGRFNDWELRCYRQMWGRARQFYSDPKWIRVTDDTGAPQYVRINDPVHAMDPMTGSKVLDPVTQQPVVASLKNDIAKMDIDIIIDAVPDTATLEQEVFQELSQLAQVYGPQNVPFTLVLEMSSLPKKRELVQKLETFQAQSQQAQAQQKQAMLQQTIAKLQAELDETKSITAKNNAQAGLFEVQGVTQAMDGHLKATAAAQLPPGVTLDSSGKPQSLSPPPAKGDGHHMLPAPVAMQQPVNALPTVS